MLFIVIFLVPYYFYFKRIDPVEYTMGRFYKEPNEKWIEQGLVFFIGYYAQPFVFQLRESLKAPTLRRVKKVARISMIFEGALFICIAIGGYYVFGDKYTPELFIVRKALYPKTHFFEILQIIILAVFFLASTFGLAIYSSSMRDFLGQFFDINKSKRNYIIASTAPFLMICIVSSIYPKITNIFDFFTYTVYNFNGYILPFLFAIVVYLKYIRKGSQIYWYLFGIILLITASLYCIAIEIYN